MGELDEAAITAHELFTSYMRAGFDAEQALRITIALVTNGASE